LVDRCTRHSTHNDPLSSKFGSIGGGFRFALSTATAGPLPVVNWSHVEDGLITRIRVTFDPRPILG
jgi:hypothetical protein